MTPAMYADIPSRTLQLHDAGPFVYRPDLSGHFEASYRLFMRRMDAFRALDRAPTENEVEELLLMIRAMAETKASMHR